MRTYDVPGVAPLLFLPFFEPNKYCRYLLRDRNLPARTFPEYCTSAYYNCRSKKNRQETRKLLVKIVLDGCCSHWGMKGLHVVAAQTHPFSDIRVYFALLT